MKSVSEATASQWSKYVRNSPTPSQYPVSYFPETEALTRDAEHKDFLKHKSTIVEQYPHEMCLNERHVTQSDMSDDETNLRPTYLPTCYRVKADSYDSWIRVGWALRNIDHRLLKSWTAFSQKSAKYTEGECEKYWHHMKRVWWFDIRKSPWAQLDDPEAFSEYASDSRRETVMEALSGTHNDLARLVYSMYKDEFVARTQSPTVLPIQEP
jgi:hypothetical protein